jgi:excisionase family DNA binding protein
MRVLARFRIRLTTGHVNSKHDGLIRKEAEREMQGHEPKLLLKVEEAAAALSLGRAKTYELVAAGQIESIQIGRSRRIPARALQDFIDRQAEGATVG